MILKKNILFWVLCIGQWFAFSQKNEGFVQYKLRLNPEFYKQFFDKEEDLSNPKYFFDNQFTFTLKFNRLFTSFDVDKKSTENREKQFDNLLSGMYIEKNYFDSKKNSFFISNNEPVYIQKEKYLMERKSDMDWQITKEEKIIKDRKCFKATAQYQIISVDGTENRYKVEAWYCPDIKLPYGPSVFHGLPGLVVQVDVDNFYSFELDNIVYKKTKIVTKESKKSKPITFEAYKALINKYVTESKKIKGIKETVMMDNINLTCVKFLLNMNEDCTKKSTNNDVKYCTEFIKIIYSSCEKWQTEK